MKALLAALALLASAGALAQADPGEALRACRAMPDGAERLSCYDAIALPEAAAPEQAFGKPARPAAEPENIRSRLKGSFSGWERGTKFALENGQVWQAVGDDKGYYPGVPDNPGVTITRSFLGAYWLEVDGVGRRIKVKRRS